MSVAALLDELRARDIHVWNDGGELRCSAPAGRLPEALRDRLRQQRGEILDFLRAARTLAELPRAIVPLQAAGRREPVFAVPGHNGDVFCFRALAARLGPDQPFHGLQPPGADGNDPPLDSVAALAAHFAAQIQAFAGTAPCVITGYCAGGSIAFELACQLRRLGTPVRHLILLGCPAPGWYRWPPQLLAAAGAQAERLRQHARALAGRPPAGWAAYLDERLRARRHRQAGERAAAAPDDPVLAARARIEAQTLAAVRRYVPGYFDGHISAILPDRSWAASREGALRWPAARAASYEQVCGPDSCTGATLLREPYVAATATLFQRCRQRFEPSPPTPGDSP